MTNWVEFEEGLAEHLTTMPTGVVVVIDELERPKERRRFAQFRRLDEMIWAELPGDDLLDSDVHVREAGVRVIAEAGWQQPDSDHCDNWWYELRWPANSDAYRRLASMIVTGMRDAYRIATPDCLVYDAWNERAGNRKFELPRTGLRRAWSMAGSGSDSATSAAAWRACSDVEIVDLATTLQSLVWSWRMDDILRLLTVFLWRDPIIQSPDWVRFDAGFGAGSCDVIGHHGDAERIEVAVTTLSADNATGQATVRNAFDHMTAVLTDALGEPSQRIENVIPEIRWAGEETTLRLMDLLLMVRLCLVTNTWLADYDKKNGLHE